MVRSALILALVAAQSAASEPWPALYDVRDVASDVVLNIRAGPAADTPIIGALAPDATDIEVMAADASGQWGLINVAERSAWVALRFLARQPEMGPDTPPAITTCYGTEPFWSLDAEDGMTRFSQLGDPTVEQRPLILRLPANRADRWAILMDDATGFLRREQCHDGMSDRTYGLSLDLVLQHHVAVSGCCSLSPTNR